MKRTKKLTALTAAACVALSSAAMPVLAEEPGTYTDVLRGLQTEAVSQLEESYRDFYDKLGEGFAEEATAELTLGEAAGALIQTMGVDLSWFDNLTLSETVSGVDSTITGDGALLLNGTEIATVSELFDMAGKAVYFAIPEISEQDFKIDLNKALELAAESAQDISSQIEEYGEETEGLDEYIDEEGITESTESALAMLALLTKFNSLKDIQAGIPSPEIVAGVYAKAADMVFNHLTDAGSVEVNQNVNGISQEGTSYTATMSPEEMIAYTSELLHGMQESQLVQWLYTVYFADAAEMSYEEFAASLGEAAEEIESTDPAELGDFNLETSVVLDAEGNVIGETSTTSVEGEDFTIGFATANDGAKSGLHFEANIPESMTGTEAADIVLSGSGDVDAAGAVTGDYVIAVNDEPVANIHADNAVYDKETGECAGSLTISLVVPEDTQDVQMLLMGTFTLKVDYDIAVEYSTVALTLGMSGADVATLKITDAVSDPAQFAGARTAADYEPAVDALDQNALNEAAQNINVNGLLQNAVNAGMPETFIEDIMTLFAGAPEDTYEGSADIAAEPVA